MLDIKFKNIVIFGGSGYIGMSILGYLLSYKNIKNIYILDIVNIKKTLIKSKKVKFIKWDIRNEINLLMKNKIDLIINLAATHREPGHKSEEYFDTNVGGSKNIVKFAKKNKVNNIIFTSSIAVYGNKLLKKNENSRPYPETPYGISKLKSEKIFESWQAEDKERILTISRPCVVFGKNEKGNMDRLKKLTIKKYFLFAGNKKVFKATIYIKELINQLFWVNLNQIKGKFSKKELFNSTTHPVLNFEQIVNLLIKIQKSNTKTINLPFFPILLISKFLNLFFLIAKIQNTYHPTRIKKLKINNYVEPRNLMKKKYKFLYTHFSSFSEWLK